MFTVLLKAWSVDFPLKKPVLGLVHRSVSLVSLLNVPEDESL
jgi:hypothetical protein